MIESARRQSTTFQSTHASPCPADCSRAPGGPLRLVDADDIEVAPRIPLRSRDDVFVATSDLSALRHYLEQHQLFRTARSIRLTGRGHSTDCSPCDTADLFSSLDGRLTLLPLARLARELAQFQTQHRRSFHFLPHIVSEEYTPVSHVVETALYSVALATAAAVRGIETLAAFGIGGVFAARASGSCRRSCSVARGR